MPVNIDTAPALEHCWTVRFHWGAAPTILRYAKWEQDLVLDGDTYFSANEIEVRGDKQHGGVRDAPWYVKIRNDRPPLDKLLRRYAHAKVWCTISDADPSDPLTKPRPRWFGRVASAKNNLGGVKGVCELKIIGVKSLLEVEMGVPISADCPKVFGSTWCGKDLVPLRQTGTIASITNFLTINASGLTQPRSNYWTKGWVEIDGLAIKIEDGTNMAAMLLEDEPPPEWVGQQATFTPGCMNTPAACAEWDNTGSFGGIGIKLPVVNPTHSDTSAEVERI